HCRGRPICDTGVSRSACDAKKYREAAVDLQQIIRRHVSKDLAKAITPYRHSFVDHDLRGPRQSVVRTWRQGHTQQGRIYPCAGDRQNSQAGMGAVSISLNDQCRSWLAKIALQGNGHQVAALHAVQPSMSVRAASMKCRVATSRASARAAAR